MNKIKLNPLGTAIFVLGLFIFCYFIFSLAGALMVILGNPNLNLNELKEGFDINTLISSRSDLIKIQVLGTLGAFLLPVLITSKLIEGYSLESMHIFAKLDWKKALIAISFLIFGVLVLSAFLAEINQLFPIPEYWRKMEEATLALQKKLILGKGLPHLLSSLAVVAFLPAILEEFFFRGLVYQVLLKLLSNRHAAVWGQGILFGLAHANLGQMLPIIGIGVLLGYIASYSKNIWYGVFIHFLNNAFAVVTLFYANSSSTAKQLAETESLPLQYYILGIVVLIVGMYLFMKTDSKRTKIIIE